MAGMHQVLMTQQGLPGAQYAALGLGPPSEAPSRSLPLAPPALQVGLHLQRAPVPRPGGVPRHRLGPQLAILVIPGILLRVKYKRTSEPSFN